MKSFALALLSAWLALPVAAQTVDAKSRVDINTFTASDANRQLTICLVPDIQNMVSSSDFDAEGGASNCAVTTGYCTGSSCTASPWCSVSWRNTGEILLRNMAYSLTGQWTSIDYSAIDGTDTVRSKRPHPLDHGPCDLIAGLGDNLDTANLREYNELTADMLHQYAMAKMFWTIIRDSGIPFIIARGNHEGEGTFEQLLADLGVSGLSFYHDGDADGEQYAVTFPTRIGKNFCALTLDDDIESDTGDEYTAGEKAWILATAGCGSALPTILIGHIIVGTTGALGVYATDITGNAAGDPIFIVAGGHYTPGLPISVKTSTTNLAAKTVFTFFSNWQEWNRHNTNVGGNGISTSDGIGGAYTVIQIDANSSRFCAHDWNPYHQSRSSKGGTQDNGATELYSSECVDFDFDARFP